MAQTDHPAWMEAYRKRLARQRVPISVSLELTHRCNLRCVHCYLGSEASDRGLAADEMTTEQVKKIIDEVVAAGCLNFLITGGDPMIRKDFAEIYTYARKQGLVVTVFCDGLLVNEEIIEAFRSYPPQMVEISLYGATAATYEGITRVKGSFSRCLKGVRRLTDAGVCVGLKTVLMTLNVDEFDDMRRFADSLNLPFRMDSAIFPCMANGDRTPLDLRVDPEVSVAREFSDEDRKKTWKDYANKRRNMPANDRLYVCGAGVTELAIDPFGWASPCLMATYIRANMLEDGFDAVWNGKLRELQDRIPRTDYQCSDCDMRAACSACPAFNFFETGEEDVRSDYSCATAAARWRRINESETGNTAAVVRD